MTGTYGLYFISCKAIINILGGILKKQYLYFFRNRGCNISARRLLTDSGLFVVSDHFLDSMDSFVS